MQFAGTSVDKCELHKLCFVWNLWESCWWSFLNSYLLSREFVLFCSWMTKTFCLINSNMPLFSQMITCRISVFVTVIYIQLFIHIFNDLHPKDMWKTTSYKPDLRGFQVFRDWLTFGEVVGAMETQLVSFSGLQRSTLRQQKQDQLPGWVESWLLSQQWLSELIVRWWCGSRKMFVSSGFAPTYCAEASHDHLLHPLQRSLEIVQSHIGPSSLPLVSEVVLVYLSSLTLVNPPSCSHTEH